MTNEERKVIEVALEALLKTQNEGFNLPGSAIREAIIAIKEALAQPDQDQDEVDIRSRLYQRIHELETQLTQPEQEPVAWATKDDFYRELERELKRIREEMKIKSVTMRCKDYDIALPIIGTDFGRVLVGQVSTPPQRKPLTDEQMWELWNSQGDDAMEQTAAIAFARDIEAAHNIKE